MYFAKVCIKTSKIESHESNMTRYAYQRKMLEACMYSLEVGVKFVKTEIQ